MARALRRLVMVSVLALIVGFLAFVHHVSSLRPPPEPTRADGVVALTGGQARIAAAIDILEQGGAERLLVSGAHPDTTDEEIRRHSGGAAELYACCVDVGRAARSTYGNAQETSRWVRDHGYDSIILVTSYYHMPRSVMTLRASIDGVAITPWPVQRPRDAGGPIWRSPATLRVLASEYAKLLAFLARDALARPASDAAAEP